MAPRKRSAKKRGWPDYLYERGGYFSWRDPRTGKEYGLGRDAQSAFAQAREANLHLAQAEASDHRLIHRLTGGDKHTVGAWVEKFEEKLAKRDLAANTLKTMRSLGRRTVRTFGANKPLREVTALDISGALEQLDKEGKQRTAQAWRSYLKDLFREAEVDGWIDQSPVRITRSMTVKVKRERLVLENFWACYEACRTVWLRNAMALALVSAQRPIDIATSLAANVSDEGWRVEQRKTGNRILLPLDLRLDVFGMSLGEVIKQCRQTGVLSLYLIHHTRPATNVKIGDPVFINTISKRFKSLVDGLGKEWAPGKTRPTFYEIRSLSERLYQQQGNVNTQQLLGHRDPRMTQLYDDARGSEWVRVTVRSGRNNG